MITKFSASAVVALSLLTGCGTSHLGSAGVDGAPKAVAPDPQLAVKQFVDAHGEVMAGLTDIKASNSKAATDLDTIKGTNQKSLETAQRTLQTVEKMSSAQGTGEITVFFPAGSAQLAQGSLEYDRLVRFADFITRESKGRKIIFLSIGSASAFGDQKVNMKLAQKRSEVPLDVLGKYLINAPHEFFKVYGTGDMNSPKGVRMAEHQRYQHTRIIAVFDKDQAPTVAAPLASAAQ